MKCNAKLTLTLRMEDKRDDGFNNLKALTVFLNDVYDTLMINLETVGVTLDSDEDIVLHEKDNLVKKAYELFLKQVIDSNSGKLSNVGFSLKKSIPVSAGLGGGSSDAACALKLLNEEIADYFSIDQLADLGSQIGSDVPACVYSQALWMKGRGEVIELITDINLNDLYVLVVTPTIYCSTPQVFQHYEKMKRPVDDGRETKYLNPLINNIHNDLAIAAFNLYPELNSFKSELNKIVNEEFNLAGSGSTLFLIGEKGELESHQRAIRDYFDSKKLRLNAVSSLF